MSITVEINPLNKDDKLLSVPEIAKLLKLEYGYSITTAEQIISCLIINWNKYT